MKLTEKSTVFTIFGFVATPLLVAALLPFFGTSAKDAGVIAAVYVIFGLPLVLIIGWLVSAGTKNLKNALLWSVLSYTTPALIINLAIISFQISQ